MKPFLTVLAALITLTCSSPTDRNGAPIFNSIVIGEDSIGEYRLVASYYTLQNNIENKGTSVYISDKPTLDQIEKAATTLPSDAFILVKRGTVIRMILVNYYPEKWLLVVSPAQPEPKKYKLQLNGDITAHRADELVKAGYDPASNITGDQLTFNGKHFTITPNAEIKQAVIRLIENEHLTDTTGIPIPSAKELHANILKETKPGGNLDFFTPIKGHEMDGVMFRKGIIGTRIGIALYNWGKSCKDLGVATLEEAYAIYAEYKGRTINIRESRSIKDGFEKKDD